MRRLTIFCTISLFLLPVFAHAEQAVGPYTRYCHGNNSDIFTGIAYDYGGHPKITLAVDPVFNEKMKRERFTPDLPLAPVYDLVVTVVPVINEYCLPEWDNDGHLVKKVDPPKTLPFKSAITLGGQTVLSVSSLTWNGAKDDAGEPVYEWHIKGWPNGIVSESKMERLIRAIHDNRPPPKLVVKAAFADDRGQREETGAGFTPCAPVWGSGAHEVVYDRVAHRLSDFIYQADSIISNAFLAVDPFKAYKKEFSHVLNLNNYQGKNWFDIKEAAKNGTLPLAQDCGGDKALHIAISPLVPPDDFASAISSPGRFIQIASDVTQRMLERNGMLGDNVQKRIGRFTFMVPFPLIALHEFGHAFAGLHDEYVKVKAVDDEVRKFILKNRGWGFISKNCSSTPSSDWSYKDVTYGDNRFEGCVFSPDSYRPSSVSIMKGAQSGETRFNVVSCGYIVAAIKGGGGPEYWPECMNPNWNTIKPTSAAASLGMNLASLFPALSFAPPIAAVGSAMQSSVQNKSAGQNIYVEHMSADGTFTGETLTVPAISYVQPPLADVPTGEVEKNENPAPETAVGRGLPEGVTVAIKPPPPPVIHRAAEGQTFSLANKGVVVPIPQPPLPPVEFGALPPGASVEPPQECLDATGKATFAKDPSSFQQTFSAQSRCAQSLADATTLLQKKDDLTASSGTLRKYIEALAQTLQSIQNLTTLDGQSFALVGAGEPQERTYDGAKGLAMWCVSRSMKPLGIGAANKGPLFTSDSDALRAKMKKLKDTLTKRFADYVKGAPKNDGWATNATLNRLSDLKDALETDFVPLSGSAASAYPELTGAGTIPLAVTLERGSDGKTKKCSLAFGIGFKLKIGGVDGDFLASTVTADGHTFTHDCVPDSYLLAQLKQGIVKDIQYFQTKKTDIDRQLRSVNTTLAALQKSNYNCGSDSSFVPAAATSASGQSGDLNTGTGENLPEHIKTAIKTPPPPVIHRAAEGEAVKSPSLLSKAVSFIKGVVGTVSDTQTSSERPEDVSLEMLNLDSAGLGTPASLEALGPPVETLEAADKEIQKYFLSGEGGSASLVSRAVLNRYKAMLLLARTDPDTFFKYATVKTIREKLPPLLQKYIEKELNAQGILNVYHIDDFKHYKDSRYDYQVLIGKNLLSLTPSQPLPLRSGTRIALKGYQLGSHLVSKLQDIKILSEPPLDTIGDQKTLVLLVNYQNDKVEPFTPDEARKLVFNGQFEDFMKTQSYGKVSFSGDVYGWWTIPEDEPTAFDCTGGVSIAKVSPFFKANDIDLAAYSRVIFFFPKGWACSSIGKAAEIVNGKVYHFSEAWIMGGFDRNRSLHTAFIWTDLDVALAHEMGHGLGLRHANAWVCSGGDSIYGNCEWVDYGNPYDTMGQAARAVSLEYNAMYKRQLNWLTPTDEVAITGSGDYFLAPLENENGKRVAHIAAPGGSEYFIEYRRPISYDQDIAKASPGGPISGLFINRKFRDSDDSRLIDATPKTSGVYDQDLRGDAVLTDKGEGVNIGPVISQDDSGITFQTSFRVPVCVPAPPARVGFISTTGLVDDSTWAKISILNRDIDSCGPSVFRLRVATSTAGWKIDIPQERNEVSVQPGAIEGRFGFTVHIPPLGLSEADTVTVEVMRDNLPGSTFQFTMVAMPYDIVLAEPNAVAPGEIIKLQMSHWWVTPREPRKILFQTATDGAVVSAVLTPNELNPSNIFSVTAPKTVEKCVTGQCSTVPVPNGQYDVFVVNNEHDKIRIGTGVTVTLKVPEAATSTAPIAATSTPLVGTTTPAFNLKVASTTILGSPAGGENRFYAGETTIRTDIVNDGPEISQTFGNTIQYRPAGATEWTNWIQFDVAGLVKDGHIRARHVWQSRPGDWEFRVVADSMNAIPESDETDNYSPIIRVSIVSPPGAKIPPNVPEWAKPELRLLPVKIQGESAGSRRFYADSAVISGTVRNAGDAPSAPAHGLFQISPDGRVWSEWLGASVPRLGAGGAGHSISYHWTGGVGVWHIRFGVEDTNGSVTYSASTVAEFVTR